MFAEIKLAIACLLLLAAGLTQASYEHETRRRFHADDGYNNEDISGNLESQLFQSLGRAVESAPKNSNGLGVNLACERIQFGLCSSMPYNYTRMPNFFQDPNQVMAAERAKQYLGIVRSGCSSHLLTYLCELLAPICLDSDASKKFEVFPCRSFCSQVRDECSSSIEALFGRHSTPKAFDCDSLPYESNGGDGTSGLRGPCHEMPSTNSGSITHSNNNNNNQKTGPYQPYSDEMDWNGPPFGTDMGSRIDPNMIRVPSRANQQQRELERRNNNATDQPTGQVQGNVMSHVQALGQQLALVLVKYSNVLSILTLICLLLVVNAKRLKRLKSYLAGGRKGSSSSSSSSSNGSQRKLAKGSSLGPGHKLSVSPSSSSRSLMLVATADGKHARPNHKLVSEQLMASLEPSQKLIQAGLDRRTLINVNGTLERQKDQTGATRYHLMQSALNNRELNQRQQQHQHHQYDYIQHTGGSQMDRQHPAYWSSKRQHNPESGHYTDEPQVYSNILLSSPSHQVLLFSDRQHQAGVSHEGPSMRGKANEEAAGAGASPRVPWMGPPQSRSHFITAATNLSSPYAAPEIVAGGSINRRQTLQQLAEHQRSFQRRPSGRTPSTRHWGGPNNTTGGEGGAGGHVPYITSGTSTSSSSSANSSSLAFSSGEPNKLLIGGGGGPSSLPSPPPVPRTSNSQR